MTLTLTLTVTLTRDANPNPDRVFLACWLLATYPERYNGPLPRRQATLNVTVAYAYTHMWSCDHAVCPYMVM